MFKPYLKSIVRNGGKGRMGLGIELFRLDALAEEELTAEEMEVAEESKDQASTTAVMRIYEEIGEDFWTGNGVSAKRFADELSSFGDIKRLNIHINSLGGDVFAAQAIHSIISDHTSAKTAYIDGVAASAATLIACGADEVVARLNTNYMLHYPWAMAVGNAETMRKAAEDLDAVTVPILSVYKEQVKGKIDEDKIKALMEDETWLTAEEALEYGFVDKVRGKIKAIAKVSKTQILCSGRLMDVGKYHYRNVPQYPTIKSKAEAIAKPVEPKQKETKKMMTREEIDPQLLATIENEARTAERVRLAALDALNGPGLAEIVAKAKADGKQPKDIALECLNVTKAELASVTAVSALARDAKAANAVRAGDAPMPKAEDDRVAKNTNLILNAFKAQHPNNGRQAVNR
jgi:ATP-dependent Clp protease, protease subunit